MKGGRKRGKKVEKEGKEEEKGGRSLYVINLQRQQKMSK
jgi:hypothetical protein